MSQRSYTTYHIISHMYCLKKRKNLSLSTIVRAPLQSAGWQMVRLSTCNWNTVCRFALFVCWTQWNRHHLLAISRFCSNLQAPFFFLSFVAGVDLIEEVYLCAGLVLRRHVVCAVWGEALFPHPSAACSRKKCRCQGVAELGKWVQGHAVLFRHLMVWEWTVTYSQWGPAGWLGGNQSWAGGWGMGPNSFHRLPDDLFCKNNASLCCNTTFYFMCLQKVFGS